MQKILLLIGLFQRHRVFRGGTVCGNRERQDSPPLPGVSVRNIRTNSMTISTGNGAVLRLPPDQAILCSSAPCGYLSVGMRAELVPAELRLAHRWSLRCSSGRGMSCKKTRRRDSLETREEFRAASEFPARRACAEAVMPITPVGNGVNIQ